MGDTRTRERTLHWPEGRVKNGKVGKSSDVFGLNCWWYMHWQIWFFPTKEGKKADQRSLESTSELKGRKKEREEIIDHDEFIMSSQESEILIPASCKILPWCAPYTLAQTTFSFQNSIRRRKTEHSSFFKLTRLDPMMSDNKSRECCTIQSIMHYLLVWTFEEVEVEGKKKRWHATTSHLRQWMGLAYLITTVAVAGWRRPWRTISKKETPSLGASKQSIVCNIIQNPWSHSIFYTCF